MANITRKGFWPKNRVDGQDLLFIVDAASGTAMFRGDIVSAVAAGAVNPAAADDGNIVVGTVLELFDTNMIPVGRWGSLVSTKYLTASTAGFALVALALPGRVFTCQTDTILTAAAIFASSNHVAGAGSTTTGESNHTLSGTSLNTGAQVFIAPNAVNDPTNDITLAGAKWQVIFNEGIFMGTGKATGV